MHIDLANGSTATLFDKPPIFGDDHRMRPDSEYPFDLALACVADTSTETQPETMLVTLACGLSDPSGEVTFRVPRMDVAISAD